MPSPTLDGAYDPAKIEPAWYRWWEAAGVFQPSSAETGGPAYTALLPPANVTGQLHIGHALTCTLEDALVRWRRMCGDRVQWIPGTDHAGIATQTVVERRLWADRKVTRHQLGRAAFLDEVWAWKAQSGGRINEQLRRMGASLDWRAEYFTMDEPRAAAVTDAFVRLHRDGLIYRATRMVNWCCHLRTVISDIEVDTVSVPGRTALRLPGRDQPATVGVLYHVRYPVVPSGGGSAAAADLPPLVVATTRPETILGDQAVAVHPDDDRYRAYVGRLVRNPVTGAPLPVVALADLVDPAFGTGVVKVTPAQDFADHAAATAAGLPLGADLLRDDGTLSAAAPPPYAGMDRFAARAAVLDALRAAALLAEERDHAMAVSVCSRSGDLLEPRLLPQWFVATADLAARAHAAVAAGRLEFVPAHTATEWARWLTNSRDWCISRQLWWGHRIPAYRLTLRDGRTGAPVAWPALPPAVRAALAQAAAATERGDGDAGQPPWIVAASDAEARDRAAALLRRAAGATTAGGGLDALHADVEQDPDVLDTWFSSALLPLTATGGNRGEALAEAAARVRAAGAPPLAFMETGHDILFFWVARMVMLCSHLTGGVLPFARVLLHPVVRDAQGRKMSKSLGNVIDPVDVIDGVALPKMIAQLEGATLPPHEIRAGVAELKRRYPQGIPPCGADALRLALAQYPQQSHFLNLDTERIVAARLFGNKLWNATKFAVARLAAAAPSPAGAAWPAADTLPLPAPAQLAGAHVFDRWLLHRLAGACRAVEDGLAAFELSRAATALREWFYTDLCDFYIEAFKEREPDWAAAAGDDAGRAQARATLAAALDTGLRALHPFMPFLSEHLWQAVRAAPAVSAPDAGRATLSRAAFPRGAQLAALAAPETDPLVQRARGIVHAVRSLRQNLGVPHHYPGPFFVLLTADGDPLVPLLPLLGRMCRAPTLRHVDAAALDRARCSFVTVDADTSVGMDLAVLPDPELYVQRLSARQQAVARSQQAVATRVAQAQGTDRVPAAVRAKWAVEAAELAREAAQLAADLAALRAVLRQ